MGMRLKVLLLAAALPLAACKQQPSSELPGAVNAERIVAANPDEWLSYGRTYDEQRHSPLDQINQSTIKDLGLAWFADLDTSRGQEATPLAIDGKTMKNALDEAGQQTHIMSVVGHDSATCYAQKKSPPCP